MEEHPGQLESKPTAPGSQQTSQGHWDTVTRKMNLRAGTELMGRKMESIGSVHLNLVLRIKFQDSLWVAGKSNLCPVLPSVMRRKAHGHSRSPGEHVKLVTKDEWKGTHSNFSSHIHRVKGEFYVLPLFLPLEGRWRES